MAAVPGAVVGQDALDTDPSFCEPRHGPLEDGRGYCCGLVVVRLDVADAGVVIDDPVQVAGPDDRVPSRGSAGALSGLGFVLVALLFADEPPATTVGDLAEILDVLVEQVPGCSCS